MYTHTKIRFIFVSRKAETIFYRTNAILPDRVALKLQNII